MIRLLHGDDIEASRTSLTMIKTQAVGKEIRVVDGKSADLNIVSQAVQSQSMFGGDLLVVIERLMSQLGRKTKSISQYIELLTTASKQIDIVLWEDKEVIPTVLKSLGTNADISLFKIPVIVFQFLDALRPRGGASLLTQFTKLTQHDPPEVVMSMIVKRIRLLAMLKDHVTPPGMQSWQLARLTNQSKLFTMEQLQTMESHLLTIEYSIKSGRSPLTLTTHIEQFLIYL